MASRNSFESTSTGAVTITDTGLENLVIKQGKAQGATVHALFGSNAGEVVIKHVFEDGTLGTYQTIACTADVLNVVNIAHHIPHYRIYYTHSGAGTVHIETATSLQQI